MWVSRLELRDFRSYESCELDLSAGPVVLVGPNGRGKTNLVEGIIYSSALDSHRVHGDAPLVRTGADHAVIRTTVATGERSTTVEIQLNPGRANRIQVNGQAVGRTRDVVGIVRSCVFAPEHLRLVKGEPADRRRFLDSVMVQVAPRYLGVRSDFERALKQRNAALRSLVAAPTREAEAVLAAWDERYAPIAAELAWGRYNAVQQLSDVVVDAYRRISPQDDEVTISYESAVPAWHSREELASALSEALRERHRDEIRRGGTLIGPHRDDIGINLNGPPARTHASHGEAWSLALALQLASFDVLNRIGDDPPVLILDDVFAELDEVRRERLLDAVTGAEQILVTAAVAADVPAQLHARSLQVTRVDGVTHIE